MKTLLALTVALLATQPVAAQDVNHDGFVSFLVPVISDHNITGLQGSTWRTELWLHTDTVMQLRGCGNGLPPEGVPVCPPHFAGTTEQAFPGEVVNYIGALVYNLPVAIVPGVSLSARLFEQSNAQPFGVDVPIVREDQFFTKPVRFIGIPSDPAGRIGLRLYDPRRVPNGIVRIEVLDAQDRPLVDTLVALDYKFVTEYGEPGFAAIYDLGASFPQLAATKRIDVRLTPMVAGMEYWGLMSVTDNATQQVLLVTANTATPSTAPVVNPTRRRAVNGNP